MSVPQLPMTGSGIRVATLGELDHVRVDLAERAAQHPRLLQADERRSEARVVAELSG